MTYNVFSGTLNPTQSINQSVSALTLLAGCQEGHPVRKNPASFIPKVLSWNNWRKKIGGQMVNPCSPGKWPLTAVCLCTLQKALIEQMKSKAKEGTLKTVNGSVGSQAPAKRRRWDVSSVGPADETPHKQAKSSWDAVEAHTPSQSRWDDTPGRAKGGETPGATPGASTRQWDQTPGHASSGAVTPGRETPGQQVTPSARRNRWDETPKTDRGSFLITHLRLFTVTGVAKIWTVGHYVSQRGAATPWPITLLNAD